MLYFEFNKYTCRYRDCMHKNEGTSECMVKDAVEKKEVLLSRYENYIKFLNDKNSR